MGPVHNTCGTQLRFVHDVSYFMGIFSKGLICKDNLH